MPRRVVRQYMALQPADRTRVNRAVRGLWSGQGDIKSLSGQSGMYRLRVSRIRVIYRLQGSHITIAWIAPRNEATYGSKMAVEQWMINGKPYSDGVWIEVEPDVWYRGAARPDEIPSRIVVRRQDSKWTWEAQVLTFIGAPHEKKSPQGQAKTLEQAQERAMKSLARDHEFFRRYEERQRAKTAARPTSTAEVYEREHALRRERAYRPLSHTQALDILRHVLSSEGFPLGEQAEIEVDQSMPGKSRVGWYVDTVPPTPMVSFDPRMLDEMTLLHEAAHIIRNGPGAAGKASLGVAEIHDAQWVDTFERLVNTYGSGVTKAVMRKSFFAAKTAAADEVYRGFPLHIESSDRRVVGLLRALAQGAQGVVRDRLVEIMGGGVGIDNWTGLPNGPRSGAGTYWTSDRSAAATYSYSMGDWGKDQILCSVILEAQIDRAALEAGDMGNYTGGFYQVEEGTPLRVTGLEAELPTQRQAKRLLALLADQGGWYDVQGVGSMQDPGVEGMEIEMGTYSWPLNMRTEAKLAGSFPRNLDKVER